MTDWRKVGEELFAEVEQVIQNDGEIVLPGFSLELQNITPANPNFLAAIERFRRDDHSTLILYLLSDRPLGTAERTELADALAPRPAAHRPANSELRFAATFATSLYEEWHDRNARQGVSSRVRDMKYECALFIAEILGNSIDANRVYDLMGRSEDRRDIPVGSSALLSRK
jgi:hypothetical protein